MPRPKDKVMPIRLEVKYESGEDARLKRAITILAAMLRSSTEGSMTKPNTGNNLPPSIVSIRSISDEGI